MSKSNNKITILKLIKNNSGSRRDDAMSKFISTVTDPAEKLELIKFYHDEVERVLSNKPKVYITCRRRKEKGSTTTGFVYATVLLGVISVLSTAYLIK